MYRYAKVRDVLSNLIRRAEEKLRLRANRRELRMLKAEIGSPESGPCFLTD